MRLRRRDFSLIDDYESDSVGFAAVVAVIVFLIAFLISGAVYSSNYESYNNAAAARQILVTSVNQVEGAARQAQVDAILNLDKSGSDIISAAADKGDYSADDIKQRLVKSAESNQNFALHTARMNWDNYWSFWFLLIVGVIYTIWSLFCVLWYSMESDEQEHFLADVPKRSATQMIFMVLTFLPLGWLFYTVSAVRVWRFRRKYGAERPEHYAARYDWYDDYTPARTTAVHENGVQLRQFSEQAPELTRQEFVAFRREGEQRRRQQLLASIEQSIQELRDKISSLGGKIEKKQREYAAKKRERDVLQARPLSEASTEEQANRDFDAILALQGVTAVAMADDKLRVKVEVRVPYAGELYDFGDWELIMSDGYCDSRLLRRTTLSGRRENYPDYAYSDDTFCFHSWASPIRAELERGDIAAATALAVNALHHVNDGDEERISTTFMKAKVNA